MDLRHKEKAFAEALGRLEADHGLFILETDFGSIAMLVAQVQLALRHPANNGYSAKAARRMVEKIIRVMEEKEPMIGPLLREGFDPSKDVPLDN